MYSGYDDFGSMSYNPRRRRSKRRRNFLSNPLGVGTAVKGWTQGVGVMDAVAALGGLAVANWLPTLFVKNTASTVNKALNIVLGVVGAGAAGYIVNSMMGKKAGQAAVIGGLAGVAAKALTTFTGLTVGSPRSLGMPRSIGFPETVSPSFSREGENVTLLQP